MLVCVTGNNLKEMTDTFNIELEIMYDCLCPNNLKLNTSKTKFVVLGSTKKLMDLCTV